MIRAMPMAATVQTAHGPVGLVHASPTAPSWQTTLDNLRAGDTGAGTPDGCLMLARIDTDPIETITVSTRTLP